MKPHGTPVVLESTVKGITLHLKWSDVESDRKQSHTISFRRWWLASLCQLAVAEWWSETMADGFRNQIDMMSSKSISWWDNQSRQHRNWCIDRMYLVQTLVIEGSKSKSNSSWYSEIRRSLCNARNSVTRGQLEVHLHNQWQCWRRNLGCTLKSYVLESQVPRVQVQVEAFYLVLNTFMVTSLWPTIFSGIGLDT